MDPLSILASTLAIVQAITSTYKAIQYLKGLPNEFIEVNRNLPLTKDTLILARDRLQDLALDDSSREAIQSVVSGCEEKAKLLLDIFEKVEKGVKHTKDGSVLDLYRTSLLRLGKAHRVETLMQDILKGLDALATNHLFRTAPQSQIAQLKDAIDHLSNIESSVPDSDFESGTNYQTIASGGTGYQSNTTGHDHKINSGSGEQYNMSGRGHTMNFVRSTEGDKTRSDIFQTLYTSPYLSRKNRNPDRVPGTCEWFIRHRDFQQWRDSKSSSMLWVSANPGCGKSVLAKYLADCELKTTESRTTCYCFFKDDFEDQRSATSALSCLLHQLFAQREDLFSNEIIKRFEAYKAHLANSFDELWEVLVIASQDTNSGEVICIIDALDECEEQDRRKFAYALRKFYDLKNDMQTKVSLKFLVTSRPVDKIGRSFQPLDILGLPVIRLRGESDAEISKIVREIDVYIEDRVSRIGINLYLTPDEEQLLLRKLRRVPNQTYLWVYLTLELIENEININKNKIREVTSSLPQTVEEAYEKILATSSHPEKAKKLLHIIVAAARPLTLVEMDLALALQETHSSYKDFFKTPEERLGSYIRTLCGLFVTIIDSKVYLLHQTAKEFLVPKDVPDPRSGQDHHLIWKSSLQPSESHRILFQVCIWYLLFTEFETQPLHDNLDDNIDSKVDHYLGNHVFLDYSATNWAFHFRASNIKDDSVTELLRRICDADSNRCLSWFRIYWMSTQTDFPQNFTTLMIASYFGIDQIVKLQLCVKDVEVDSTDGTYQRSALSWASENGFDGVVKLLIKGPTKLPFFRNGATIDARDIYNRTPLSYAAWNVHMAVVQRLVRARARVDSRDEIGGTPISYALCSGHDDVAGQLVKGPHSDSADRIRGELLIAAAKKGYAAIVQRLFDNGAPTDLVDRAGRAPLLYAAEGGFVSIVQLLLDRGADVNKTDRIYDRTPLSYAAKGRFVAVVRLLLDNGADVHEADRVGRAPLSYAAEGGFVAIVQSPLLWAVKRNDFNAVELLLKYNARPDFLGNNSWTPLEFAEMLGDHKVIRMLKDAMQLRKYLPIRMSVQLGRRDNGIHEPQNRLSTIVQFSNLIRNDVSGALDFILEPSINASGPRNAIVYIVVIIFLVDLLSIVLRVWGKMPLRGRAATHYRVYEKCPNL
ncbi:hypothetical protein FSST1_009940 [Fusarium sambucinum]